jgi:large subunit ribosomal protein L11
VTKAQVKKIAEIKMPDVNTMSIESMCKTVEGTARSMGIKIID